MHEHWHVDVSYIIVAGTFFYLCSLLDGYSRLLAPWEIRESMTERDVETIMQRAHERFPEARPLSKLAPEGSAIPRIGGSPSWNRSSNASTRSFRNSWRNISS